MKVALAGNPNCGKTTLFNTLSGSHQRVGNYPGVTVEKKVGHLKIENTAFELIDLPGTYGLTAYSEDEVVARNYLIEETPDLIVNVVDASNLERNLYLTSQLMELNIPIIIALNMNDVAKRRGIEIDVDQLSTKLGLPVIPTVARTSQGKKELESKIKEYCEKDLSKVEIRNISYGQEIDELVMFIEEEVKNNNIINIKELSIYNTSWLSVKLAEEDEEITNIVNKFTSSDFQEKIFTKIEKVSKHVQDTLDESLENIMSSYRYGLLGSLAKTCITKTLERRKSISDKVDSVLLHRLIGPGILLAVLWYMYQFTFSVSEVPIGWIETVFEWLHNFADANMTEGLLKSLVISGMIDGVSGVLGFTPLIMFMFLVISFIEDSGYMARIAFILDRVLRTFGMHGNSILAFIVSGGIAGGCAVPGIMATRTLKDPKERLATILTAPFMNCGAKLPVYAVLIAAFFSNMQAEMMFLLTIVSWILTFLIAGALRLTILRGEPSPFILELPPYRMPTIKGLLIHTWQRTWLYVQKAGTVILAASIIVWALMTFPKTDVSELNLKSQAEISAVQLANSTAGIIGKKLEYITKPLMGFDWKTDIALISGAAAKEIVVATLGTAHSLGDLDEESTQLSERLSKSDDWSPLKAFALIMFTMLYMPCIATIAVIKRETNSWKWPLFSIGYTTTLATAVATIIFQLGTLLGIGV